MSYPLIDHLDKVRRAVEEAKGPFTIFVLFRRADTNDLDLVVSAPWLESEKLEGLGFLSKQVFSDDLSRAGWTRIAHIVTLNESDSRLKAIRDAFGPADGLRVIDHPKISGLDLEEAFVMRSS